MKRPLFCRTTLSAALAAVSMAAMAVEEPDGIGRFDITHFQVNGNTLLETPAINTILAPYTGRQRSFADVQRALETLEAATMCVAITSYCQV